MVVFGVDVIEFCGKIGLSDKFTRLRKLENVKIP